MELGSPALNLIYDGAAFSADAGIAQRNPYKAATHPTQYEAFELGRLRDMSADEFLAQSKRLKSLEAAVAAGREGAGHDTVVRVIERAM